MKHLAWLIEEYDSTGKMVWSGVMMSEPTEMSWLNDFKKKQHNLIITPLMADAKNIKRINNVKKYDSKRLTEANGGL